ncbi:MAG: hypothetical protein PHV34_07600 [Verrucomicrobiae bacterium]|nr:hypothetical protein [Verrucomicrobiae bacterium]
MSEAKKTSDTEPPFASNVERLTLKQWLWVVFFMAVIGWGVPFLWPTCERFCPPSDYRLSYELSNDYWMFKQWCDEAVKRYPCVLIGDSVIWGQYVKKEETLSHALNRAAGRELFANLGVDGLHPAAIYGLIKYHGTSLRNRQVIINFNPLWYTSARLDLQGNEEARFNHPGLVPQFFSKPACYRAEFTERIRNVMSRQVSFLTWLNHVNMVYFDNVGFFQWTMDHPYRLSFKGRAEGPHFKDDKPHGAPKTWEEQGIGKQDFEWVDLRGSVQWRFFRRALQLLTGRGNQVFVLVGPFNPYLLSKTSQEKHKQLRAEVEGYLKEHHVEHWVVPDLPSAEFADASHPLSLGYERMANELAGAYELKKRFRPAPGADGETINRQP